MIRNIRVFPVFNSKGGESIKVKMQTEKGVFSASIPSGTSRGTHEAVDLPIHKILRFFSKVRPHFIGKDEHETDTIDSLLLELDGTKNFSKIGENLSLAISIAAARAATQGSLWKLTKPRNKATFPIPIGNMIGGGRHLGGTDWQEFLIIPHKAKNPHDAVKTMLEIWTHIGDDLKDKGILTGRNLEDAWMAKMNETRTLDYISGIAEDWNAKLGIDFAASSLWNGKEYVYEKSGKSLTPAKQAELVEEVAEKYKVYYLEDPLHEDAFRQLMLINKKLGKKHLIVGDDIFCTNPARLNKGIKNRTANGIIIKPNQIGTLSQANDVVNLARKAGMSIIPSHRSGETYDDWLADLCIAWDAPLIKSGITGANAPKLNRLIELWGEIPLVEMAELPLI
jgi:enolase